MIHNLNLHSFPFVIKKGEILHLKELFDAQVRTRNHSHIENVKIPTLSLLKFDL